MGGLFGPALGGAPRFLGSMLGRMPGFLGPALDAFASVLRRVFRAVVGIFHVLLKAGIGTLRPRGRQKRAANTQRGTQRQHAQRFLTCNCLHESFS